MSAAIRTGLSSGCSPALSATELGRLTVASGGEVVDLRAGKGHAWEAEGLDAVRAAGVGVAFVGVSAVLGDPRFRPEALSALVPERGLPVKVFAAEGCTAPAVLALTQAQVGALAAVAGPAAAVLVETHHGYAPVPELLRLCESTGVRILVDTLGLARVDAAPLDSVRALAPHAVAAQVKGFAWEDPEHSRHLPLDACELPTRRILAALPGLASATLESKAGRPEQDLRLLQEWLTAG